MFREIAVTLSLKLNGKDEHLILVRAFRYHGPIRALGESRDYAACFIEIRHFKHIGPAHHFPWIRDSFHSCLTVLGVPAICFGIFSCTHS